MQAAERVTPLSFANFRASAVCTCLSDSLSLLFPSRLTTCQRARQQGRRERFVVDAVRVSQWVGGGGGGKERGERTTFGDSFFSSAIQRSTFSNDAASRRVERPQGR